jgi:CRISPR-associated protein Cas1
MLNEYVYCPRLFHLEWVQKEWAESADTLGGKHDHRRVDVEDGELPPPEELAGCEGTARSVQLEAPGAGIVAKLDLVEIGGGEVVPVDYKHGKAPKEEGDIWDADRIQVGAQALVLIENGYRCERAVLYYVASRRRVSVTVDEALLREVRDTVAAARAAAADPVPPPPLRDSPKCPRCSLVGICLPDEVNRLAGPPQDAPVRRLYATRDEALPLYVRTQGARVGKSGDRLEVTDPEQEVKRVRLLDVSQLSVFGGVQVSASTIAELMRRDVPICHFSYGGWFLGITHAVGPGNGRVRLCQYAAAVDPVRCLTLARGFVNRKILNCRTLLRRNAAEAPQDALDEMERLAADALRAGEIASLLGVEGAAARAYFGAFAAMLKPAGRSEFDFTTRNRRPPKDPVNALLSLAYSVLSRDWMVAVLSVGLDPALGFYHQPRAGRPALALDLMEEFRPLIADSVVIQVLNNGEVQAKDFLRRGEAVALTDAGRKSFFLAYERRMAHEVRHPLFGYEVGYRRLLEVQARLFARHLAGELPAYDGFRTR